MVFVAIDVHILTFCVTKPCDYLWLPRVRRICFLYVPSMEVRQYGFTKLGTYVLDFTHWWPRRQQCVTISHLVSVKILMSLRILLFVCVMIYTTLVQPSFIILTKIMLSPVPPPPPLVKTYWHQSRAHYIIYGHNIHALLHGLFHWSLKFS
jgi:hypothetical protein